MWGWDKQDTLIYLTRDLLKVIRQKNERGFVVYEGHILEDMWVNGQH